MTTKDPQSLPTQKSSPSSDPEQEQIVQWIEKAKNGDSDAFAEIVGHFERFVYNTACRILSGAGLSLDSADDIAQESFIKIWNSLSSFRGECCFSTWIFRITVNTAKDNIRSATRHGTISLIRQSNDDDQAEEWDLPVTSGDEVPEDALDRKETVKLVRLAIEQLPEDQRQVVIMRDIHELSYQDISDILGVELGTVKSRLNRGRTNLRTILKNGNFL